MAIKKAQITNILRPTHLQAIGMVAASWSSLEFWIIAIIAKVANIQLTQALAMAGSQNVAAWKEMIDKLLTVGNKFSWNKSLLLEILEDARKLQSERNSIVHAFWIDQADKPKGLIDFMFDENQKPPEKAKGLGFPKRGKKLITEVEKTPADMRASVRKIEDIERRLIDWIVECQKPSRLASLLQNLPPRPDHQTSHALGLPLPKPNP